MADDVLIRLLLEASQFLQESGRAEEGFEKLEEAAKRAESSGTSVEEVLESLDVAMATVARSSGDAAGGIDKVSESADRARRRLKRLNDQVRSGSGSATSQLDKVGVGLRKVGKGLGVVAAASATFFASFRGTRRAIDGLKKVGIDVDALTQRFLRLGKAGEVLDAVLDKVFGREHLKGTEDLAKSIQILNAAGVEFENTAEGIRAAILGLTEEQRTFNASVAKSEEEFSNLVASVSGFTSDAFVKEMQSIVGVLEAAKRRGEDLLSGPLGPEFQERFGRASEALSSFGTNLRNGSKDVQEFDDAAKAFGNAAQQVEQLSAVEEHHAEIMDQEAEAAKALATEIEDLSAQAEGLKALQEELVKAGEEAIALTEKAKAAFDSFGDPEQRETQAFADRQKQLEDIQRQLEEIQETGSEAFLADPAALEAERVLLQEISELEGQRITQFEEVAQSAEEASRRQAEAQSVVTGVIDGSRASLQSLTDRFPQLDEASRGALEGIISNFETELTLTDNLAAATTRFGEEFSTALSAAEEKAGVAFDAMERGADAAADAQERLKDETEGVGSETERAAESAGVLNIQMGEAITKYSTATNEASELKDVSADIRDLWGEIRDLI